MNERDEHGLRIERASAAEAEAALRKVFAHLAPDAQARSIAETLAEAGETPPRGLWAAFRHECLLTAVLVRIQPGKTAHITLPRTSDNQPPEAIRALLAHLVGELPKENVELAQVLADTDHGPDARLLTDAGFRQVSNLLYLVSLREAFPTSRPEDGLDFDVYSPAEHGRLASIVERTYIGSLDCPQIDGVRHVEDALAGYRAAGAFDPTRWWIARRGDADVGCALVADHPRSDEWELTYLGVLPEARGNGFGLAITRHVQWRARHAGRKRLVLAVDAANTPALDVYAAAGMVAWDHRSVFLRVFHGQR